MAKKQAQSCAATTYAILRILLGLLMFIPGVMKLIGVINSGGATPLAGMLGSFAFLGWLVMAVEIAGGLMVIIGYKTQWAAYPLALILVVATLMTTQSWLPPNSSTLFHIVAAAAFVHLAQVGSGKWAVE